MQLLKYIAFCCALSNLGIIYVKGISNHQPQADSIHQIESKIENKLRLVEQTRNENIKQSLILAKEALTEAQIINSKKWIAESKLAIGMCYDYIGGNLEAINHLREALTLFDELNNSEKKAITMREIANIYYFISDYTTALEYYREVFACGKASNDTSLMIGGLIGIGSVYGNTNRLDSALIFFKESFELSKRIGDEANELRSLFNIGDVNQYSNRLQTSLAIYKQIENGYDLRRINSRLLASLYNSMTNVYIKTKNLELAKEYNQKAWESLIEFPRIRHKSFYYLYRFQIDTIEKNYSSAIQNYMAYKNISDSINNSEFKDRLANFQIMKELEGKEREIDQLTLDNKLKDLLLKQRKIVNYGSIALIVIFLFVIFQSTRFNRKIKEKNVTLQEQREQLAAANEELTATNDELFYQSEEVRKTLAKLQEAQKQLVSSEKMASLGVLAAGIAHEINNPLNFIQGSIVALENQIKENFIDRYNEFLPMIEMMNAGVLRATGIVNSLNHYSRREEHFNEKCDIHQIIENCLLMLNNKFKHRIVVEKDYSKSSFTLKCNEGRMHQALLNILSNASQAIDNEGVIRIKTFTDGNTLTITIDDTGCGICPDILPKITDPFFTTKEPGKGTGLDLSITQNIINEHKGTLEFSSEVGKGTRVFIHLPLK